MTRVATWLTRLRDDTRGVSAVEFALIAPVMILLYFGLVEVSQVTMAERRTVRTASAIGDLVAQSSNSVTATQVDQILDIGSVLMSPFPTGTNLKFCVAHISIDSSSARKVDWRRIKNSAPCPALNAAVPVADLPTGIISNNQSVVLARVVYSYTGPSSQVIRRNITFTKTFYLRPRKVQSIACSTCTG